MHDTYSVNLKVFHFYKVRFISHILGKKCVVKHFAPENNSRTNIFLNKIFKDEHLSPKICEIKLVLKKLEISKFIEISVMASSMIKNSD